MRYLAMKSVSYSAAALSQSRKLQATIRERIGKRLEQYALTGHGDVKKLIGRSGLRLRVGDWRILFVEDSDTILILAIGHRREIYD